jgi:hypothetical protein
VPSRLGSHMALRSDKRKMHPLIVRCFVAGHLVLLPCHSLQSKSKRHAQLQPCSTVKFDPEKLRRPSPPGCVDMKFSDGSMIVIQCSRPKLRNPHNGGGRKVIGFVVPYGQVWRAGANEATSFVTDTNLIIGNASVPAGAYTLYVLPERREPWKLILNKTTGQLGLPYPGESSDLARIDMDSELQCKTVEQFTIAFESQSDNAATLSLEWEGWRAAVKVGNLC